MKKQIGLFTAILFAVSTLMVSCSSEVHEHTFAEEWTYDETNHWHAATCGCSDVELQKTEHTFGEWEVTKEPTEEAKGSKERVCDVCKYKETAEIAQLDHKHVAGESWKNDDKNHWKECTGCKEQLESAEHTFGEWEVTKEPTEDAKGSKERVCDVCKYKETAEIAQLNHKHVAGESWKTDDKNHWKECRCGEKLESAEHEYEWTVTKEATCTEEGTKTGTCKVCKKEVTEKIDAKEHSYSGSWTNDASGHWYECDCGAKKDFEEHTYDIRKVLQEPTCTQEGKKTVYCTVCEYEKEESIPKIEHPFGIWEITEDPTDTEVGQMQSVCEVCRETVTKALQPAPKGFRFVKGVTITGTESWTPESKVFVSGRSLTIPELIVSDHEVTRGEYLEVMGSDPSKASAYDKDGNKLTGDAVLNTPVNYVQWYDALVYCNKLSMKEGFDPCYSIDGSNDPADWGEVPTSSNTTWDAATCNFKANGYRLPTAAEWEWLARGGENYKYAGSDNIDDVAWYESNTTGTREVKTKAPNGYGLYDMSGNVFEWCWDWFVISISDSTASDGATSGYGHMRVRCGGSWYYNGTNCQVAIYGGCSPNGLYNTCGFRVVRTAN